MKVVIMAGGKGTRISSLFPDIPKPMIPIDGIPILEHEIKCLQKQGFSDIIITIGYLGNVIQNYFGDGRKLGVNIEYFFEKTPLGNAGALFEIKNKLVEDFLLLNADVAFNVDFIKFVEYHRKNRGLATLLTHPSEHLYDSGVIISDSEHRVEKWLTKEDIRPSYYKNRSNAGLHILSPKLLVERPQTEKIDLDRQILKPLAGTGSLICYDSPEYVKDMGTPSRYERVCRDYKKGIIQQKQLCNKQKAIFLDRDGTINKYVGFLRDIDDFELLPGVSEAIKAINETEYLSIVVTNQPVIARGELTFNQLEEIHNKMEMLLGENGAFVDKIYFCPHHPHRGYVGEIPQLKIDCNCRKPKPGMLFQAARDFNIELNQSWMIGDGDNDILAGTAAGCQCIKIGKESKYKDLYSAIIDILKKDKNDGSFIARKN